MIFHFLAFSTYDNNNVDKLVQSCLRVHVRVCVHVYSVCVLNVIYLCTRDKCRTCSFLQGDPLVW